MNVDIYVRLAKVLDTLPSGFPSTENGVEIKLLKKIFTPEQAELYCQLKLSFETLEQLSERTGRPEKELQPILKGMMQDGQVLFIETEHLKLVRMWPYAVGVYEFQIDRLDKELAELNEEYMPVFLEQLQKGSPQLMQTLPVEEEIKVEHEALTFERISKLLENGHSFMARDCICKKEKALLGNPCDRSLQVCLAMVPIPGYFEDNPSESGRVLTRDEAFELLKQCEEEAMVHMTTNMQSGHMAICNCCSCCCGILKSINDMGIPAASAINSRYYAVIDEDACISCGTCTEERCQVNAIDQTENSYAIAREKCIGCGLCISTCPGDAISLVTKKDTAVDYSKPPENEADWYEQRANHRGVDFSGFK